MQQSAIEYYGVFAVQCLIGLNSKYIERKLGPRDATLRRGPGESALWRVERVMAYKLYRDVLPAGRGCPVLYSTNESAWLVGVTRVKFLQIAPPAPAVALTAETDKQYALWPETLLLDLRQQIARGDIKVHHRSLTRPKAGVVVVPPRHTLAESVKAESAACRKAQSWSGLAV